VARNDIEEGEIRSQALEALVDMATVYEQLYQNDNALTNFLIRLQEGGEPALLRVGAEGSAKLLFSGRLSEPKLFSNLLKFFFLPKLAGSSLEEDKEEGDGGLVEDAFLGSTSRLQQILCVFFQSFFVGGRARDTIAFLCVSDLVADLAMLVRDGELDPCDVSKVINDLCLRTMSTALSVYIYCETIHLIFLCASAFSAADFEPSSGTLRQHQAPNIGG
jgi:Nuclear condensing complex subunits, C-term domain